MKKFIVKPKCEKRQKRIENKKQTKQKLQDYDGNEHKCSFRHKHYNTIGIYDVGIVLQLLIVVVLRRGAFNVFVFHIKCLVLQCVCCFSRRNCGFAMCFCFFPQKLWLHNVIVFLRTQTLASHENCGFTMSLCVFAHKPVGFTMLFELLI